MEENMTEGQEKHTHSHEEYCEECAAKKIKNLISVIILLAGLFLGSLFVDSAQLIRGSGYSAKNLNKSDVFEAQGKTWVAYSEPAVPVTIINDETCEKCDVSEALVWLRRVVPTVATEKIAYDSAKGEDLIAKYNVKTLPAFVFGDAVAKTDFYTQAKVLFDQVDGNYVLKTQELGLPAGKYLELPKIGESDPVLGDPNAKVKLVLFSDFQCPYCKVLYSTLRDTLKQYKPEEIVLDYKHLPLDFHAQAASSALASECALEQGKFWEYADKLYNSQSDWSNTKDTAKFKQYAAAMGLKTADFNKCLDDKKYQEKIDADKKEGSGFGIAGTPAIFVGDEFSSGAITAEQLKSQIDEQLKK